MSSDPWVDEIVVGGRFDSITTPHGRSTPPYLYVAGRAETAFAETFVRDLDYAAAGLRPVPWSRIEGRSLARLRSWRTHHVVVVSGAGAQQLGQDDWLTRCDEDSYAICRRWAEAIRRWAPDGDGLSWASKRANGAAHVIWESSPPASEVLDETPIDSGSGLIEFKDFLIRWWPYLDTPAPDQHRSGATSPQRDALRPQ